jgi:hypothetical protein
LLPLPLLPPAPLLLWRSAPAEPGVQASCLPAPLPLPLLEARRGVISGAVAAAVAAAATLAAAAPPPTPPVLDDAGRERSLHDLLGVGEAAALAVRLAGLREPPELGVRALRTLCSGVLPRSDAAHTCAASSCAAAAPPVVMPAAAGALAGAAAAPPSAASRLLWNKSGAAASGALAVPAAAPVPLLLPGLHAAPARGVMAAGVARPALRLPQGALPAGCSPDWRSLCDWLEGAAAAPLAALLLRALSGAAAVVPGAAALAAAR